VRRKDGRKEEKEEDVSRIKRGLIRHCQAKEQTAVLSHKVNISIKAALKPSRCRRQGPPVLVKDRPDLHLLDAKSHFLLLVASRPAEKERNLCCISNAVVYFVTRVIMLPSASPKGFAPLKEYRI